MRLNRRRRQINFAIGGVRRRESFSSITLNVLLNIRLFKHVKKMHASGTYINVILHRFVIRKFIGLKHTDGGDSTIHQYCLFEPLFPTQQIVVWEIALQIVSPRTFHDELALYNCTKLMTALQRGVKNFMSLATLNGASRLTSTFA